MGLLVVEDDPDLNRQLVSALSDAGYAVDTAFDGEEGHFLGDTEPYDAVVLDLGLPKKDGLSVLEQWRCDDRKMPVLISLRPVSGGATRSPEWTPAPTIMWPSLSIWRKFWRACGRCSGARPGTPATSSNAVPFASTQNRRG
jgi:hypothetical protein